MLHGQVTRRAATCKTVAVVAGTRLPPAVGVAGLTGGLSGAVRVVHRVFQRPLPSCVGGA